nr:TetR/AcrR family transcriptional regulator [uncultured Gellertiella sp.]
MVRKAGAGRIYLSTGERRAEIIEAAFRCLQEFGHARLTARKIAGASGISLGHITYNFKDMNEVLVETYKHASHLLFAATLEDMEKAGTAPLDRLTAFLNTGFTAGLLRKDYIRLRIDLWSAALFHEEIAATELALYQRYRDSLSTILGELALERGASLQKIPLLSNTIMATLDGLWLDWQRRQDEEAVRDGLEGCMILVDSVLPVGPHR